MVLYCAPVHEPMSLTLPMPGSLPYVVKMLVYVHKTHSMLQSKIICDSPSSHWSVRLSTNSLRNWDQRRWQQQLGPSGLLPSEARHHKDFCHSDAN